jgi:hypothetical protein
VIDAAMREIAASQEAGKWLRSLLELKPDALENRKVSSHSLTCTMLSYLAKRGVEMSDRLLLGYHTSPFTMGLTYSRDGMARPLQILHDMLAEIREGTFRPDCIRSGRLVSDSNKKSARPALANRADTVKVESSDEEPDLNAWHLIQMPQQCSLPHKLPAESEHDVNDACTETSSSALSNGDSSEPAFEKKGSRTFAPPVAPEGCTLWQHTKSKILHLTDHKTPHAFECGRRPGAFHTCQGINPRWDIGICWKCFQHK